MATDYKGQWVLVTGASGGLGEAFARALAARGANLVLVARSLDRLEGLAAELSGRHGVEARALRVDLSIPGRAAELGHELDRTGLAIAHVINNAGFGSAGAFTALDPAREAEMVRLNCEAVVAVSRHFLPAMVARGSGGIIHLASVAGFQPVPYMATYGATKAFVLSLSVALSEEVRRRGVRVMALCPGPVPTGFQAAAGVGAFPGFLKIGAVSPESVIEQALAAYQAGREICVPGVVNRLTTFGSHLLPRTLLARVSAGLMRRAGRSKD